MPKRATIADITAPVAYSIHSFLLCLERAPTLRCNKSEAEFLGRWMWTNDQSPTPPLGNHVLTYYTTLVLTHRLDSIKSEFSHSCRRRSTLSQLCGFARKQILVVAHVAAMSIQLLISNIAAPPNVGCPPSFLSLLAERPSPSSQYQGIYKSSNAGQA